MPLAIFNYNRLQQNIQNIVCQKQNTSFCGANENMRNAMEQNPLAKLKKDELISQIENNSEKKTETKKVEVKENTKTNKRVFLMDNRKKDA